MLNIDKNTFLEHKLWLKPYTLNGLRESPKAFKLFQEKINQHLSLKQLCQKHPKDEKYIRDCSSKYYWSEREQAKTQYELMIYQSIKDELLTILTSRDKILRSIEINNRLENMIIKILDLIDIKIEALIDDTIPISPELQRTKLPSLLMALEKLLSGNNTYYRKLLRQLGLPETLHENKEEKIIIPNNVQDKPSDEQLQKNINEKLARGSQKISRQEVYDE